MNNDYKENILPFDGIADYYGQILEPEQSQYYFEKLLSDIEWKSDEIVIFGRHIITSRKVAWYADTEYLYTYSNTTKKALLWTKELLELKNLIQEISKEKFNSCLLNLYHNGDEGMGWHSDDEKSIVNDSAIASLSLGVERKFSFKHKKTKTTISVNLSDGSLLIMKGKTQTNWLHSLPKTKKVIEPRINLTFRSMK